jgi:hypothetical protein
MHISEIHFHLFLFNVDKTKMAKTLCCYLKKLYTSVPIISISHTPRNEVPCIVDVLFIMMSVTFFRLQTINSSLVSYVISHVP